jgi:AmmeMemoRadiSam system protein B
MQRFPAVAGMFYPAAASELKACLNRWLLRDDSSPSTRPCALIVPHAGYIYSGAVAASAYRCLRGHSYSSVIIIGPAHRVAVTGVALSSASAFVTPLGALTLNQSLQQRAAQFDFVRCVDEAHLREHAIEVQLPFVQRLLGPTTLLPMLVGDCAASDFSALLHAVYDEQSLIIVSTDLSHYLPYTVAQKVDQQTVEAITQRQQTLSGQQACGAVPLNGFLQFARQQQWNVRCVSQCNSGDTAGDRDRVVGYASFVCA